MSLCVLIRVSRALCVLMLGFLSVSARADEPIVIADTLVTHSLVSMVMGNLGSPLLLIDGQSSPHDFSLRPSDAKKLHSADLVVWTSTQLTPWLDKSIKSLASSSATLELMMTDGTIRLLPRHASLFEHSLAQQDLSKADAESGLHAGLVDPHGWLDPENAILWLQEISTALSTTDAENAPRYQQNAAQAQIELKKLDIRINELLSAHRDKKFIVFHDSYQYFESRYGLHAVAAISASDASSPAIRRISKLRKTLADNTDTCVFSEPQFNDKLVKTISKGLNTPLGTLDPVGITLSSGPKHYPALLLAMAQEFSRCFDQIN